ncbi:MAG: PAS domain S-box protein [Verrucomicrobia bacterium]|jgi:two-component system, cell cycle sensor histidine kinase and response regulator CckA|nr:PAS domain S-box protein [Verrucomicrobiota bacterium]MBT7065609.1 PAS domain S-box protein [Verrucomicrobiota bacterium]MBT7702506.1 PAS domain S-box protein [Verrucomicrobiota bacterium]
MQNGMFVKPKGRRALIDLCVALIVAATLAVLNLAINFSRGLNDFFTVYARVPVTDVLINLLFFWLLVLLIMAFRRWRSAAASRVELEAIISGISPDVLLVVLPNRDILMCNASVERMFGYRPDEVVGCKSELLYFDRRVSQDRPREIYDALKRDGFHIGEARGKRRTGETFPMEIIAGEIGGRSGAVLLLRDVSERKEAQERGSHLQKRIVAQQKMESLGLLAGGVAHDFNNLLAVIQGNGALLKPKVEADAKGSAQLDAILSATDRAAALCRQMLAYAGNAEFSIEPLDLSDIVSKTSRLMGVSLGAKVSLHCHVDEKLPVVRGDAVQLQQVVMNLLLNASEAIGDAAGHVMITTVVRDLEESYLDAGAVDDHLPGGTYVCLDVKDSGGGIDGQVRARIFDPFFSTKPDGRGLGLASVIGIVRAHKGTLHIASERGTGTTFTVILPCERTAEPLPA